METVNLDRWPDIVRRELRNNCILLMADEFIRNNQLAELGFEIEDNSRVLNYSNQFLTWLCQSPFHLRAGWIMICSESGTCFRVQIFEQEGDNWIPIVTIL
jgi:hypothetical protein